MTTLLIAEHDNSRLNDATRRALTAAIALGGGVHVLVAGLNAGAVVQSAALLAGVEKVLHVEGEDYAHQLAEPCAALIVSLAAPYAAIIAPATATGKNLMPRVAALLDVMQVSEVTRILAPDTFERPIYAGNAVQTVQTCGAKAVLTVRTSAFAAAGTGGAAPVQELAAVAAPRLSAFRAAQISHGNRPELASAKVVIAGGRSLGSAGNFASLIDPLADMLGAAIGASRAAVDLGYAPNDWQIGQTGKVVAPDLYIAVGISGAIQHVAGMKDSRVIVAINKDEEAPIFQVADYGLVGDLFQILPELQQELRKAVGASGSSALSP